MHKQSEIIDIEINHNDKDNRCQPWEQSEESIKTKSKSPKKSKKVEVAPNFQARKQSDSLLSKEMKTEQVTLNVELNQMF